MAEFLIGKNFKRDGSDYDPHSPTPALGELISRIQQEGIRPGEPVVVTVLGILYPGGLPDGMTRVTTVNQILRVIMTTGGGGAALDPAWTIDLTEIFMKMDRPAVHIYGFVFRDN